MRLATLFTSLSAALLLSIIPAHAGGKHHHKPPQYEGEFHPDKPSGGYEGDFNPGKPSNGFDGDFNPGKPSNDFSGDFKPGRPSNDFGGDFRPGRPSRNFSGDFNNRWEYGGDVTEGDYNNRWEQSGDVTEGDWQPENNGPDASGYIDGDQQWFKPSGGNRRQAYNNRRHPRYQERYIENQYQEYGPNDFPPAPIRN